MKKFVTVAGGVVILCCLWASGASAKGFADVYNDCFFVCSFGHSDDDCTETCAEKQRECAEAYVLQGQYFVTSPPPPPLPDFCVTDGCDDAYDECYAPCSFGDADDDCVAKCSEEKMECLMNSHGGVNIVGHYRDQRSPVREEVKAVRRQQNRR